MKIYERIVLEKFNNSDIIKCMSLEETKRKSNQQALRRGHALQNGLYIFKNEYAFKK